MRENSWVARRKDKVGSLSAKEETPSNTLAASKTTKFTAREG